MSNIAREVIPVNIEDELRRSYMDYAMSVILARAFPDVRDGLKPVQRRILVAMNDLHLGPIAQHRKSAKIAGDTSGNYHPHGEQVIYPTMVRMAQDFSSQISAYRRPGQYGIHRWRPAAAMRYTEMRMSPFAMELLDDLEKDTVDWQPNYDQTREEPAGPAVEVSEPAGKRHGRHRGRDGDQDSAAQSRRALRWLRVPHRPSRGHASRN